MTSPPAQKPDTIAKKRAAIGRPSGVRKQPQRVNVTAGATVTTGAAVVVT